jgi:hypothetical protein
VNALHTDLYIDESDWPVMVQVTCHGTGMLHTSGSVVFSDDLFTFVPHRFTDSFPDEQAEPLNFVPVRCLLYLITWLDFSISPKAQFGKIGMLLNLT